MLAIFNLNLLYFHKCDNGAEVMSKENLVKNVFEAVRNKDLARLEETLETLSSKEKEEA